MRHADYIPDELHFAYCYHVYFRWSTHRLRPHAPLARLDQQTLGALAERFALHVLVCDSIPTEVRTLVSLRPAESVSTCASKLKGQTSRWLREALGLTQPLDLLSKGYFACTSGKSESRQVEQYLSGQGEHHGYAGRVLPPAHVEDFDVTETDEVRLQAKHAHAVLQFHVVLATWNRRGVFGTDEARAVVAAWRGLQAERRFALRKVSFVPDHVHIAARLHPAESPASLVVALMNEAEKVIWERFPGAAIRAGVERLWQPSAYVGSFGDLATPKVRKYLENWAAGQKGGS
ncbi:MAG TPA: IS200/IS605 family transposase [Gemmataceae bacterium]|nr:IS200/IS605 family transposase [Gemmataceae bacterium]